MTEDPCGIVVYLAPHGDDSHDELEEMICARKESHEAPHRDIYGRGWV